MPGRTPAVSSGQGPTGYTPLPLVPVSTRLYVMRLLLW